MNNDPRFNFLDSPTRSLTEAEFLAPGGPRETWEDALFRGSQKTQIDSLEKLARSFGSPMNHVPLNSVEKTILTAGQENSLDARTEISGARRTESVSALEFIKVFLAPEPSSSSALNKSADPRVARVEKDVNANGEIVVSEYGADGKLLRGWISATGELPSQMQKALIVPDRETPTRVPLPNIFERRAVA